jgi:aryl-alcohol dehydrogenase-like predicted oxidoreductase
VQQGTERATAAVENSLSIFGGFVDLMLIHWPGVSGVRASSQENSVKRLETWRVLESTHEQGRCTLSPSFFAVAVLMTEAGDMLASVAFVRSHLYMRSDTQAPCNWSVQF